MSPIRLTTLAVAAALLLGSAESARAQGSNTTSLSPTAAPRPSIAAQRRTSPVTLDGRLDDEAWTQANAATAFIQQKPAEGAPASQRTEVRFLYDEEALYIGARMYESGGGAAVTRRLVRHDDDPQSDVLRVDLDTYHDRLHSVEFDVNPAGWRGDASDYDRSWDPVWEAAARIDSLGWTAEIRIPFSQLRFSRDSVQSWGLNLTRITHRTQERAQWAFWRQQDAGGPAFFGDLTGIRIQGATRHVELLPYAVTRDQRLASGDRASPFYRAQRADMRAGADLKVGLTNSFTLAATVNPDFGQVEVDPAVVNLSAYETFFPEKRPFFVEGSNIFGFGQPGCNVNCEFGLFPFYSRRIGRAPQGAGLAYAAGRFADVPQTSAILGAAKLTGRSQSGYTVGVIDAVTRPVQADVATADGRRIVQPVEPLTNSLVARVKRDLRGGNLVVGAIATSVQRRLQDPGLAALLPRSAWMGGADVEMFWRQHSYRLYAAVSTSEVAGDSGAILRLQRAPARYLQRPGRRNIGGGLFSDAYDPAATRLGGYGTIARIAKQGGSVFWDLNAASVSPGYETNDLGFLQRAGWRWLNGSLGRQLTTPTRWYRTLTAGVGGQQYRNFDGDLTGADLSAGAEVQFLNYWTAFSAVQRNFSTYGDRVTRGGPTVREPAGFFVFSRVGSDPRRRVVLSLTGGGGRDEEGGFGEDLGLFVTVRPASNVRLSVGPRYRLSLDRAQYVTAVSDPTATAFSGRRYVFARLDQRQLGVSTRASVTFAPRLSLDLFAQPLIASGSYSDFEEFAAPRELTKVVYGRDRGTITTTGTGENRRYTVDPDGSGPAPSFTLGNQDFTLRSLRGTAVLRWEWRPGSTAYLVWTQTRSDVGPEGDFAFARDRHELFNAPADNIFVLKVSYWLGR